MPGLSGLELQQRLNEARAEIPIIFITGHGDVPMAVNAMKSGAADFIQKPFRDQELLDRIHNALQQDRELRAARAKEKIVRERLALLTPRETEVMQRVVKGQANKVIALDLGVSQRTVELHRARVMRKLKMRSVAELVQAVGSIAAESAPYGYCSSAMKPTSAAMRPAASFFSLRSTPSNTSPHTGICRETCAAGVARPSM